MRTIKLDFTKKQSTTDKEKIMFGVNDTVIVLQILLNKLADLSFVGPTDIIKDDKKIDHDTSTFMEEISTGDYKTLMVRQIILQINNNVDTQQLLKFKIVSDFHSRTHSYYFVANKQIT